ncbi:hypothetical protein AAFF_G00187800 [Aldrovandia affinis]|uniref:Uncharacterized protein n=1 Tax=Aldrovandia affinis TaxID=143900 RepID=A0AAD7SYS2_9TELE|nr:hypothetical protein AAFF_G00187800 [Aldrovandia affinis]
MPKERKSKPKEAIRARELQGKTTTVLHGAAQDTAPMQLTKEQKATWVKSNNRCWRCGRHHQAAQCRLKVLCKTSKREVAAGAELKSSTDVLYLDRRAGCNQVLLKVSKVLLRNGEHTLETYAILDDGSERTILLQDAAKRLQLQGTPESLILRTAAELFKQVEKLWQLDTLPYRSERLVTRSRRDQEATNLLEAKTTRVEVEGVLRYATPLLRVSNMPMLTAPPEAALSTLRGTEKHLSRDPVKAEAYRAEIMKLRRQVMPPERGQRGHRQAEGTVDGGRFELRQWASNIPDVISHLPKEISVKAWEDELPHLDDIRLPRCYVSLALDHAASKREVHIFCDASQWAYGSVGYLRTEDAAGHVEVAFLTARSRVAPKRQLSIPRLELCAALTGAQLANLLIRELTLEVSRVVMWTDSTTVLAWIQSDSCRF